MKVKIEVEKVVSPVCKECGSFRVIMLDEGLECDECGPLSQLYDKIDLSMDIEYLIYQLNYRNKVL